MSQYRRIAQIIRAKGLSGEVVALSSHSLSLHIWQGLSLWLVPPEHDLVRATTVLDVQFEPAGSDALVLKLAGVDDRGTAQRLCGRYLLAAVEDCGDFMEDDADTAVDLRVEDERLGFLGTVVEERVGFAQTLWVVQGPFGELMIPVVDEFIVRRDANLAVTRIPDGLLELGR